MTIVRLDPARHARDPFTCGSEPLDRFLKQQAAQDQRRDLSSTYVALAQDGVSILGYVTVVPTVVALTAPPVQLARVAKVGPLPALLVGRLAVDREHQGRGIGKALLEYSLRLAVQAASSTGCVMVVVDAKEPALFPYYQHLGFAALPHHEGRLFITVAKIRDALGDQKLGL